MSRAFGLLICLLSICVSVLAQSSSEPARTTDSPASSDRPGNGSTKKITPGRVINQPQPQYPKEARKKRITGTVSMRAMVHKDGKVEIVTVLDGNSLLAEAASRSVSTWQFDPYQMDGEPVDMPIQVRVTFGLSSRREPFFSADYYPDAVSPVAKDDSLPNTSTPSDSLDQNSSERVYKVGEEGVTPPHLKKGSDPEYTDNARRRKIQGTVVLQCIITSTGTTRDVSVTRSLEPGLDKQAVETVRDWQFDPGTKDGSPVSVKVTIEVTFRLYHSR